MYESILDDTLVKVHLPFHIPYQKDEGQINRDLSL